MRQGIHSGRRGDMRRQADGQNRVEHRVARTDDRVRDRGFFMRLGVRYHRRNGGLGTRARRGRNREDRRREERSHLEGGKRDLEQTPHLVDRTRRAGDPRADALSAIHRRPAAEGYDGLAVVGMIDLQGRFYVIEGRVGLYLIVEGVLNTRGLEGLKEGIEQMEAHQYRVGDHQYSGKTFVFNDRG